MMVFLLRAFLTYLHLPLLVTAAPNQRRAVDNSYGEVESAGPTYFAQTTLPESRSRLPKTNVPSTLQTLPNASPLPSGEGGLQQSASTDEGYGTETSSVGRYPLYNSTAPYGSGGAWLPGTAPIPEATSHPSLGSQGSAGSDQACSQNADYAAQTVTTTITDAQTVTTVVTSTQTVTSVATSTSVVTAYVTVTTTQNLAQGTGSPIESVGGGLGLSNANAVPYPTTAMVPNSAALGLSKVPVPGATYPGTGVPFQSPGAFVANDTTLPAFVSTGNGPIQPQDLSTPAYVPNQIGFGSAGQPVPSMTAPVPDVYGNTSAATGGGVQAAQASNQAYASQGIYSGQQEPGNSYDVPLTNANAPVSTPAVNNPYQTQGIYSGQQEPGNSYDVPLTNANAPVSTLAADNPYPNQGSNQSNSTGTSPYEGQNEGPGPQLPSTLPPLLNNTQDVSSAALQPAISSPIPPYPIAPNLPESAGFSFQGTGGASPQVSTNQVIPVPATSAPLLPGTGTNLPGPLVTSQALPPYNLYNVTTDLEYGAISRIPYTSIPNPFISGLPYQSVPLNTTTPVPSVPIPSVTPPAPLPDSNPSLPLLPDTTQPPTNVAPLPISSAAPSLAPIESSCTPSTTTYTAIDFSQFPTTSPLPLPYLGLNYTTFTPTASPQHSYLLSSTAPHMLSAPANEPNTTFTLLSLLLSCSPQPSDRFCTVDLTGIQASRPNPLTGAAMAGIARMSINVPPASSSSAGNGQEVAAEGVGQGNATVPGVNGGTVPAGDGSGVGVPVAFTGSAWTGLTTVGFGAKYGGPWGTNGTGETGVGIDEVVYVVERGC